jgi:hypothetical protein
MKHIIQFLAIALFANSQVFAQEKIGDFTIYRDANPSIWIGDIAKGSLTHKETNVAFPEKFGEFKRTRVMAINDGRDVMVHYALSRKAGDVEVSVFLFQPGNLPEHHLKGALQNLSVNKSILDFHIIWSNGPFDIDQSQKLRLFKGTYKTGLGPNTIMDYLYFGKLGKWTVKVRATMPSPQKPEEEQEIDKLVRDLPWTSIILANGPCAQSACDINSAMPFDHHMGEMFLSKLTQSGQGKKLSGDEVKPLFESKIGKRTWKVFPLPDAMVQLFNSAFGALTVKNPTYSLSWEENGKSGIVRFFSGKPDQVLFDKTVESLTKSPEETAMVSVSAAPNYVID